jgi:hypothetical protein
VLTLLVAGGALTLVLAVSLFMSFQEVEPLENGTPPRPAAPKPHVLHLSDRLDPLPLDSGPADLATQALTDPDLQVVRRREPVATSPHVKLRSQPRARVRRNRPRRDSVKRKTRRSKPARKTKKGGEDLPFDDI